MPLPRRCSRHDLILIAVLAAGLGIRLAWALSHSTSPWALSALPDQIEYLALARNFLHAGTLCFFDPRFRQTVWAYRMPGYPLFIAGCGGNLRIVQVVQAILDASTVLAIYLLARRMLAARTAAGPLWAAAIVAVNPFLVYFAGLILSETLFTSMLAWGMYLLIARPDGRVPMARVNWWVGMLILSVSVLVRPEALVLVPLLVTAAWAMNCTTSAAYKWSWLSTVACAVVLFSLLLPWERRNSRVLGQSIWLTTNGGVTLYDGNHPGALGNSNQSFLTGMPQLKTMGEVERNAYLTARAADFIEHHPGQFSVLALQRFARTWSPMPLSEAFGSRGHVVAALAYSGPFDLLILLGLISWRLRPAAKVFLMMPAIYLTAVHVLTVGSLRYLVPAQPPMAILAAVALARMLPGAKREDGGKIRRRRIWRYRTVNAQVPPIP